VFGKPFLESQHFYSFHREHDEYLRSAAPDVLKALLLAPFEVRVSAIQSLCERYSRLKMM